MRAFVRLATIMILFAPLGALAQSGTSSQIGVSAPVTHTVYFGLGQETLDADARSTIAEAVEDYRILGSAEVDVVGHTDTSGSAEFNQALSERRAQAVAAELERQGVPVSSIVTQADGQNDLAVQTGDGVREPLNRRVVVTLTGAAPAPTAVAAVPPEPEAKRWNIGLGPYWGWNLEDQSNESDGDKNSHFFGANLSFDYRGTNWFSLGAEQAVFYNTFAEDGGLGGRTAGSIDFGFTNDLSRGFFPSVGANIGYLYGEGIEDSFFAGPEISLAIGWFKTKIAYDMPFNRGIDDGVISGTLGVGLNF